MAPEIKSKGSKARRVSGQTLRLRKKHWKLTGLKADRKHVAPSLPSETSPSMHPTNSRKSADRVSFIPPDAEDGLVEISLEDPWVRRQDVDHKRRGRGYGKHEDVKRYSSEHDGRGLLADTMKDHSFEDEPVVEFKSYKRRFYILLLFSVISFSQYCAWNTYGPVATTAKMVFGWTNTEIAFLASMDPITYLCSMLFFSWMMDEKGLRLSIIISCAFMFLGTGLRCVTSHPSYAIWSMGAGQLLNGLAGPVTQAAPTLLSSTWFPSEERTTSTAVAALCGSLGVAISFVMGPLVVKDIRYELDSMIPDRGNLSANLSDTLDLYLDRNLPYSDSVYRDAAYYWPLDDLNITVKNVLVGNKERKAANNDSSEYWNVKVIKRVRDLKTNKEGLIFNECVTSQGVVNQSLETDGKGAWVNFGSFVNTCVSEPSLCPYGLTVTLWIKYAMLDNNGLQYFMGTSGTREGLRGFLIYQDFPYDKEDHLAIKVENGTTLWKRSFPVPRDSWTHVTFTWDERDGLVIYANGSTVGGDPDGKTTEPEDVYFTTFTLGRPNNEMTFSKAAYDEIVVWERKLHLKEIEAVYKRTAGFEEGPDLEKEKERLVKEGRKEIMTLLYVEFGVITFLFVFVVIYFPNKPPLPPSKSAKRKREDFFAGAKQIFRNKQFWTLALVYGVTTGVYSGWGASLAVNLESFSIGQNEAGWIGFYATIAGIGAGLILARCADLFGGKMKALLLVLFFGASACFLWFSLLCLRMIQYDDSALYKSSILSGFFVSGTIPLFYELTVESTYPVAEGVTTGLLTLINNTFTVIFLLVLMIPGVGTVWMNWCMFGACAGCIPILLGFHENYRRLSIDKEDSSKEVKARETDKISKRLKSPIGSILSFTHVDELVHKLKKAKESNI